MTKGRSPDPFISNIFCHYSQKTVYWSFPISRNASEYYIKGAPNRHSIFSISEWLEWNNKHNNLISVKEHRWWWSKYVSPQTDVWYIKCSTVNTCEQVSSTTHFLDAIKLVKVIQIYKAINKEQFEMYRLISLLSNISKIFEKYVHGRALHGLESWTQTRPNPQLLKPDPTPQISTRTHTLKWYWTRAQPTRL